MNEKIRFQKYGYRFRWRGNEPFDPTDDESFGIAYFACAYMYRPGRLLLTGASVIGMATAMPIGILLKYIGVILGSW